MSNRTLSRVIACAILALLTAGSAFAVNYTFTDLGTLGGMNARGLRINNSGQITGYSDTSSMEQHAYLYTPGSGMTDLGDMGYNVSGARDINSGGQVVGDAYAVDGTYHPFLYTPGVGMQELASLGASFNAVYGINASGKVVGTTTINMGQSASVFTPGVGMTLLGGLGSEGRDINTSGQVAGVASFDGEGHAFLYTPGSGMLDLGTPQNRGYFSEALGMNDSGQVVGYYMQMNHDWHGFLYTPGVSMIDIGTIGGDRSIARDINSAGWVVGDSLPFVGCGRAFVRPAGSGLSVLPIPQTSLVSMAFGINDNGWITGMVGFTDGSEHVALWKPVVPEPSSFLALGTGLLGLMGLVRRKRSR